jgi:antitoxin CptB
MKIGLLSHSTYTEHPTSDADTAFDDLRSGRQDVRRKRLLFRSWHRGTQESDFILGLFAEISLNCFDGSQLDRFEALLDCADVDLFDWIIGSNPPPPQHDHDVMHLLRAFCARPSRAAEQQTPRLITQE